MIFKLIILIGLVSIGFGVPLEDSEQEDAFSDEELSLEDGARDARQDCNDRFGCHKGNCWAGCNSGFPIEGIKEWCYTTKGRSQDFKYVRCSNDRQCNRCWRCAGSCTV